MTNTEHATEALALLRSVAEDFAPAAFATSLGVEDMVLTDLIARHRLPIEIFTLDTTDAAADAGRRGGAGNARARAFPLSGAVRRTSDGIAVARLHGTRRIGVGGGRRRHPGTADRSIVAHSRYPTARRFARRAGLHEAVTLVLEDELDVSRGEMIVHDSAQPRVASVLDAKVCWLSTDELDVRRKYIVRQTTREVRGVVASIDHLWNPSTQSREAAPGALRTNDIGQLQLKLAQPLCIDTYSDNHATGSFILVDEVSNNTIAAGMIQ